MDILGYLRPSRGTPVSELAEHFGVTFAEMWAEVIELDRRWLVYVLDYEVWVSKRAWRMSIKGEWQC